MSRQDALRQALVEALSPVHLEIENESSKHSVPPGSETHFRIVVVSGAFEGLRPLARHRRVHEVVAQAFREGLHALSVHAKTPAEWGQGSASPASPPCLGGSKAP